MRKYILIVILFFMGATQVFAGTTVPHVFNSGDIIKAEEINQNFDKLSVSIDTGGEVCSRNIKSRTEEHYYNDDGKVNYRSSYKYTYNEDGTKKEIIHETDSQADGIIESRSLRTYVNNSDGTRTERMEQDNNGNGIIESVEIHTYNTDSLIIEYSKEIYSDETGKITSKSTVATTYNSDGYKESDISTTLKYFTDENGNETERKDIRTTIYVMDTTISCNSRY